MYYSTKKKTRSAIVMEAWEKAGINRFFIVYSCGRVQVFNTEAEWLNEIKAAHDRKANIMYLF